MNWISMKDRLPDYGVGVLVTDGKIVTAATLENFKANDILWWSGHEFSGYEWEFDFETDGITHWMPLPEPPA